MISNKIKGVIFDLDGTLLDSMFIWEDVDRRFLCQHGYKATEEISRALFTLNLEEGILYMKEVFHIEDTPAKMMHDLLKMVEDFYTSEVHLKPYAKEFLEDLKARHIPMCIATSNQKGLVLRALEYLGIEDDFVTVLTCDEAGANKDKPDIYDQCCRYMNTKREETYVFEDALHAIETVSSFGFPCVAIYDEYSKKDKDKIKTYTNLYFKDFQEVRNYFKVHI